MDGRFAYKKMTPEQRNLSGDIILSSQTMEYLINGIADCREKDIALTKLEEMVMWANKAISHRGLKK